jgi:23S rRNA U2552 (ribose-2'-O)-methylase RlmE/FtsJ
MLQLVKLFKTLWWALTHIKSAILALDNGRYAQRGTKYSTGYKDSNNSYNLSGNKNTSNPLEKYFDNHKVGHGIWKWTHYFNIYDRHFSKYIGKEVHILEVGIYSGGSLDMWKQYFGDKCKVYGVDILEECKVYETGTNNVKIFIGDQEDRNFWQKIKAEVPRIDIIIDDGGHLVDQQIATLEEVLPHLSEGGVYLCEDVCGNRNRLAAYMNGLQNTLNNIEAKSNTVEQTSKNTTFQRHIHSIHQYPYVYVIEKRASQLEELEAPKHGTIWGPFYKAEEKI